MFEYVGSGTSYFKLMYEESYRPENLEVFAATYGSLNNQHEHKISLLYNAFTEKRTGPRLKEHYAKHLHTIHADSGGLQMITLGKTITDELKEDVYANQALNSDVAMCFDLIPVVVLSERTTTGIRSKHMATSEFNAWLA